MYFIRTPYLITKLFPKINWALPNSEHKVFLTFDDGPHPEITPRILAQLKKYEAKATFFCLGQNAEKYPELLKRIKEEGHALGNHSYSHLNGWRTEDITYMEDIRKATGFIHSSLFRPPYGKIKRSQLTKLSAAFSVINWSLMPGDFDQQISSEECYQNLVKNIKAGDIICLHDNEKTAKHLEYCLPRWLEFIYNKGLRSDILSL